MRYYASLQDQWLGRKSQKAYVKANKPKARKPRHEWKQGAQCTAYVYAYAGKGSRKSCRQCRKRVKRGSTNHFCWHHRRSANRKFGSNASKCAIRVAALRGGGLRRSETKYRLKKRPKKGEKGYVPARGRMSMQDKWLSHANQRAYQGYSTYY
jgi:hypothetical protein